MVRALAEGLRQEVMSENTAENLIRVAVSLAEYLFFKTFHYYNTFI